MGTNVLGISPWVFHKKPADYGPWPESSGYIHSDGICVKCRGRTHYKTEYYFRCEYCNNTVHASCVLDQQLIQRHKSKPNHLVEWSQVRSRLRMNSHALNVVKA